MDLEIKKKYFKDKLKAMKKVQTHIHIIRICIEEGITTWVYFVVYKVYKPPKPSSYFYELPVGSY